MSRVSHWNALIWIWYVDEKQRLNTGSYNYASKWAKIINGHDVIDMPTLTLSDLKENERDEELDFQFWIIFFRSFIPKFLLCWDNFYFIHFTVCCYICSFYCDLYTLMLCFSRNSNLDKFYESDKILFYTSMFLKKLNFQEYAPSNSKNSIHFFIRN